MVGEPASDMQPPPHAGLSLGTLAAHAGLPRKHHQLPEVRDPHALPQNAHITPLFQTTVFDFESIRQGVEQVHHQGAYEYARVGLPNADEMGAAVAALEGAEAGVATSSGMGAITASLLSILGAGDVVIAQYNGYGGTLDLLEIDLPRFGITVMFEDMQNLGRLEELLFGAQGLNLAEAKGTASGGSAGDSSTRDGEFNPREEAHKQTEFGMFGNQIKSADAEANGGTTKSANGVVNGGGGLAVGNKKPRKIMMLTETVSNPLLLVMNIKSLAALAKRAGAILMVDNTFGTPLRSRPLSEGADLVMHSATKFMGGHHDLLAGAVVGRAELIKPIKGMIQRMGLSAAPLDSWLAIRGLRTLQVRMEKAWANAAFLGRKLETHPQVKAVTWHEKVALVTFVIKGGFEAADAAVKALRLISHATSLGGVTTTISHPATSSHASLPAEQRAKLGISDSHLRVSVGIEDADDLWADLNQGLSAAGASNGH